MPSLNITTRQLAYTQADANALEKCVTLLEAIVEFDRAAKDDAAAAKNLISSLWTHVNRSRTKEPAAQTKPKPKIANAG